jgi:hypothetical protein
MSKAKDHKTPEELAYLKARFDYISKRTRGYGRHPALGSPLSGKNKAQRQRITAGMSAMQGPTPLDFAFPS